MSRNGISNDTFVVFYGDKNNWWACYALWVFELFGHTKTRGHGRRPAEVGEGRPALDQGRADRTRSPTYHAPDRTDYKIRAFRDDVLKHTQAGLPLVDVRSPGEYSGQLLHMEGYPQEGALRGGHIPGAVNVPWAKAANPEDGTFKTAERAARNSTSRSRA